MSAGRCATLSAIHAPLAPSSTLTRTSDAAISPANYVPPLATSPKKSLAEIQPYIFAYSFGISIFSPTLTAHQLLKVYKRPSNPLTLAKMSVRILPHQTLLKMAQMNAACVARLSRRRHSFPSCNMSPSLSTPINEYLSPWIAFAFVGQRIQPSLPRLYSQKLRVHEPWQ